MIEGYISRAAAIEEIDKWLDTVGTALVGKGLSYYGELIGCIEDTPAADVAPVVHGDWLEERKQTLIPVEYDDAGEPILHDYVVYRCDQCGRTFKRKEPYCNCGARMGGAE